jgi:hypothetical protein
MCPMCPRLWLLGRRRQCRHLSSLVSQFAIREVTHHTYCKAAQRLTRINHVSCRCGNVDRLVATRLQLYSLISHHAERPPLTRISHVSCRCGDVDSVGRYRQFRHLSSLSGRYQSNRYAVATGSFEKYYIQPSLAHLMLQSSPRIGIPHLVATKFKCCGFRTRIRHPPPGRYQV